MLPEFSRFPTVRRLLAITLTLLVLAVIWRPLLFASIMSQVVVYLPSVGGEKGVDDYFKLFDYDIGLLIKAFTATQ